MGKKTYGYEETEEMRFKNIEFRVNINTKVGTTVIAVDLDGNELPVKDGGVINITFLQNKAKQKTNSGSQPISTVSDVSKSEGNLLPGWGTGVIHDI